MELEARARLIDVTESGLFGGQPDNWVKRKCVGTDYFIDGNPVTEEEWKAAAHKMRDCSRWCSHD